MSRSIGASMTKGGDQGVSSIAGRRRRSVSSNVRTGAFERSLWPLGLRQARHLGHRSGLVQEDHPEQAQTPMIGWRVEVHSSRACLMSGRSCSLARRAFFEAIAKADEPTRKRGGIGLLAGGGGEFGRQLRHGDVSQLLGDLLQKKRPMRFELASMAAPATRLGREASPSIRKAFTRLMTKETDTPRSRRSRAAQANDLHRHNQKPAHADQANTASASRITSSRKRITSPTKILLIQAESPAL